MLHYDIILCFFFFFLILKITVDTIAFDQHVCKNQDLINQWDLIKNHKNLLALSDR